MRKLILITALLAASTAFAQAGESRSLSLAGVAMTEPAKPIAQVSVKLAQAATVPAETTAPAATTTTATTTETKTTETKPAKKAKKATRESDEHKARRIAAKYGVYW